MTAEEALAEIEDVIVATARRMASGHRSDVADLAQVGREAAWLAFLSFNGDGSVTGWMAQKARYGMLDYLRTMGGYKRNGPRPDVVPIDEPIGEGGATHADFLPDSGPGPERMVIVRDEVRRVAEAIGSLKPRDAEAVRCVWRGDLAAVAEREGISQAATSFRRKRAMRVLRSRVAA